MSYLANEPHRAKHSGKNRDGHIFTSKGTQHNARIERARIQRIKHPSLADESCAIRAPLE
jgi:hypothetical protein